MLYGSNVDYLSLMDLLTSEVHMNGVDLNSCEHKVALILELAIGTH